MQTDPIGYAEGPNWCAYAANNPVNVTDPSGLDTVDRVDVNGQACGGGAGCTGCGGGGGEISNSSGGGFTPTTTLAGFAVTATPKPSTSMTVTAISYTPEPDPYQITFSTGGVGSLQNNQQQPTLDCPVGSHAETIRELT
jgi:hypothetical protein